MRKTGEENAEDVKDDEPHGQIGEGFMDLFDPLRAPQCVGCHHVTGDTGSHEHDQKPEYHDPASRIMAEIPGRPEQGHVAQIGENGARRPDEVAEIARSEGQRIPR